LACLSSYIPLRVPCQGLSQEAFEVCAQSSSISTSWSVHRLGIFLFSATILQW
jgi:hypothetical protein